MDDDDQIKAINAMAAEHGEQTENDVEEPKGAPEAVWVELPRIGRSHTAFARELGSVAATNGVMLRDSIPMVIDPATRRLSKLVPQTFRTYMEKNCVTWVLGRRRKKDDEEEPLRLPSTMSLTDAQAVLHSHEFLKQLQDRQVRMVAQVRLPRFDMTNKISLLDPGYDPETQVCTDEQAIGDYDETLTAEEALVGLREMFGSFPFEGWDGKSCRSWEVFLAGMLTPFILPLLPKDALPPLFVVVANEQGAGKSLLCRIMLLPTMGPVASRPFGKSEEEFEKKLDSCVLNGARYLLIDNVKRKLQGEAFENFLTASRWGGRVLGGTVDFEAQKQIPVYISANNLDMSRDIRRRSLFVEMFVEQLQEHDTLITDNWVLQPTRRRHILSCLWALVRNWDAKGRPRGPDYIRSYEDWSYVVGGILHAAGLGDPCRYAELITSGDQESEEFEALLELMAGGLTKESPRAEWTLEEVVSMCREKGLLTQKIDGRMVRNEDDRQVYELSPKSRSQLGKFFAQHMGKTFKLKSGTTVKFGRRGSKNARRLEVAWPEVDSD